ncbi:type II toxin-antitoxin system HicA family toxin [Candidatus Parcubacteria bacterium]|nr:type II toxin-antitoxin system HicA family toxin [Candidatus Parcubacteria bacterium]
MPAKIDITDCSWGQLCKLSVRCGFFLVEGSKHTLVKEGPKGKQITTIPRHNKLNKWTAKAIIEALRGAGCSCKEILK